jgi:peptide deformylase
MAIREIVTPPNPTLRERARTVRAFTPELQELIDDMIETLRAAPGVGLAAPQVDVSQRVIIVEYAEGSELEQETQEPPKPPKLYVVVNPEVRRRSRQTVLGNEACLSLPGYVGEVERAEQVTIRGFDRFGNDFKLKAKGWLARIFQHEIDHLDGVLFIDRATEIWRLESEQEGAPAAA